MSSNGYAGYHRACDALRGRGVAIDVPAAGILGEGTHCVTVEKVIEFDEYLEVTFVDRGHNATHKQRVYSRDRVFHDARPHVGASARITLGWPAGCYRTERVAEGYMAIIDGEVVGGPYATMAELDRNAKESKVKRAFLQAVEFRLE